MIKYMYIGTNCDKCCIMKSLADFKTLSDNIDDLEADDFVHDATNWDGCDSIDRTCKLLNISIDKDKCITLNHPIVFNGVDYDCGHEYKWEFTVNTIYGIKGIGQDNIYHIIYYSNNI